MAQIVHALEGMSEACRALDFPIVSGNVSLYNETTDATGRHPILPTPGIAGVGLVADARDILTSSFAGEGDVIVLLGEDAGASAGLGGSQYQSLKVGKLGGPAPSIDLDAEKKLQRLVLELARAHVLTTAHDVADGGLAVTLAECCSTSPSGLLVGAQVTLPSAPVTGDTPIARALFGESPSRVVVATKKEHAEGVLERARAAGVPARQLGHTTETGADATLRIAIVSGPQLDLRVADLRSARESCLESIVGPR